MRSTLFLCALLVPSFALAQTLSLQVNQTSATAVGKSACGTTLPVQWTAAAIGATPCSALTVWATTQSACESAKGDADQLVGTVPSPDWNTQGSGTLNLTIDDLPIFSDGGTCGAAIDQTVHLCANFTTAVGFACGVEDKPTSSAGEVTVRYDAVSPPAPTLDPLTPLDSSLGIRFTANGDDAKDLAFAHVDVKTSDGGEDWKEVKKFPASNGSAVVDGLQNGTSYEARVWVEDEVGNRSPDSNVEQGTPVQTAGFWSSYVQSGGSTGCASGAASGLGLALLGLVGLVMLGRRQ